MPGMQSSSTVEVNCPTDAAASAVVAASPDVRRLSTQQSRFCRVKTRLASLGLASMLLLVCVSGLHSKVALSAEAAPTYRGVINQPIKGSYGWRFGTKKNRAGLTIRVPWHRKDLLFRVQGYDIDGGEVTLYVNGRNYGNLLVSGKKAFNQTELWWIPQSMQRKKGNVIRLVQNTPGTTWGVRRMGVYIAGSKLAQFGALEKIDGDNSNPDLVRVIVPKGTPANRLQVRYFGLENNGELRLYVAGRERRNPRRTRANGWSNHRSIDIPGNRRVVIDFYHYRNARRSSARNMQPWGVQFISLRTASPGGISSGGSTTGGSSSGTTTGGSSGGTTTDGSSGGTTTDGSSGGTTTDGSSGGGTTDGSSGGTTTDGSSGGGTTDGSSGGTTTDGSSGGTTTDGSSGGTTTDGSSGGTTTDGSSGGGTTDGSSGGGTTDGSSGGGTTDGSSGGGTTDGSSGGGTTDGSSGGGTTDGSSGGGTTDGSSGGGTTDGGNNGGGTSLLGLPTVSNAVWDETAVRKVLHTFAYGGHASHQQIQSWANMHPHAAIQQIMTMSDHNTLLSPRSPDDLDNLTGIDHSLFELSRLWSSDRGDNRTPWQRRREHRLQLHQLQRVWFKSVTARGLNPFRSKIALWETNYHMAVNHDAGVYGKQLARYYDDVVSGLENNESYEQIIARAAASAAVAEQYKHKFNRWENGRCECNEDFAREYHQLFFGILGRSDPYYHETVTIKNTAKMLTDMRLYWKPADVGYSDEVVFGKTAHHTGDLEILRSTINGADARQKINRLAARAINHPESLAHLPILIIRGLADDRLDANKQRQLRAAWKSMSRKSLLDFLRAYAVSTLFHDKNRIKYLTSLDRHALLGTRIILNNEEAHNEFYDPIEPGTKAENFLIFAPKHNVFGGQTGIEAARSTEVFRNNYNLMTEDYPRYWTATPNRYNRQLKKKWERVIPRSADGSYRVRDVAPWLWNYIVADGLKNFGDLEKAQVYAFLSGAKSLQNLLDSNDRDRVITSAEIRNSQAIQNLLNDLGNTKIDLGSNNVGRNATAQTRIGGAFNFIAATPFIFAQEGR